MRIKEEEYVLTDKELDAFEFLTRRGQVFGHGEWSSK